MLLKKITPKPGEVFSFTETFNPQLSKGKKFVCLKVAFGEVVEVKKIKGKEVNKSSKGMIMTFYDLTDKSKMFKISLNSNPKFTFYNTQQESFKLSDNIKPSVLLNEVFYTSVQKVPIKALGLIEEVHLIFTRCTKIMAEIKVTKAIRFYQTCLDKKEVNDFYLDMEQKYLNFKKELLNNKTELLKLGVVKREALLNSCTSKYNRWVDHYQTLSTIMSKNHINRIKTKTDDKFKKYGYIVGVLEGGEKLGKKEVILQKMKNTIKHHTEELEETTTINNLFTNTNTFYKNA